ncbi:MAG: hypothetical protein IJ735_00030 [Clostridia bacterium]|nr:hypothetical protein [Clostridia bacterium]
MEQWQKDFEKLMAQVGTIDDVGYFISVGKNDKRIADAIIDFVKKNDLDTFGMWDEDSGEKYHKYKELIEIVLDLRKKYGQIAKPE